MDNILKLFNPDKPPLILAPMAALSHTALRILIEEWEGADLYFSEMMSCGGILGRSPYNRYYLSLLPHKEKMILQLMGSKLDHFIRVCRRLEAVDCAGIDINMGCAAPVIRKKNGGIAWMRDIGKARELIGALRPLVVGKTLSVKLRLGEKEDFEYLAEFARGLEGEGIDFITLHPRTGKEKLSRTARWQYVSLLKEVLSIPVIGNGDVRSTGDYLRMVQSYKPDGIMLGREAVRKPWIFYHIRRQLISPDHRTEVDLLECWRRFFELLYHHQPADYYPSRCRRFFYYATENLLYGHNLNMRIQNTRRAEEVQGLIENYLAKYSEFRYVSN